MRDKKIKYMNMNIEECYTIYGGTKDGLRNRFKKLSKEPEGTVEERHPMLPQMNVSKYIPPKLSLWQQFSEYTCYGIDLILEGRQEARELSLMRESERLKAQMDEYLRQDLVAKGIVVEIIRR